jgi:hypothetical protein
MKYEYHEAPKAGENFEQLARDVFQVPKIAVPKKQPKAKPKRRKATGSDKGLNGSSCPVPVSGWHTSPCHPRCAHAKQSPIRRTWRESVSLRHFQNCNALIMNHFRNYSVKDESK